MTESDRNPSIAVLAVTIFLGIVIFALDLAIPLGIASGVLYVGVIFVSFWSRWRYYPSAVAGATTLLTILGYLVSPTIGTAGWQVLANRALAVAVIWATAILGNIVRSRGEALRQLNAQLEQRLTAGAGEVHDREERLRAILETCVEGIITIDEQGIIQSINASAERLFGYTAAEAVGKNVTLLMPAPYRDEHDSYLAKYRETGEKQIIGIGRDVVGQRQDGSTFPMHLSVSEVPLSTGRIFTGFVHDLSERVAAERDLRRLAAIVEDSNDAITLQEFDGTIIDWNHGAERMYGYSAEEATGMSILAIVPESRRHESDEFRDKLAHGGKIDTFETQRITKSGMTIDVWLTATVLHDLQGQPIAVATTERNITERKRIRDELEKRVAERTRELQEAHDELLRKERLATLGQLAGGVAHEIRNPLGVIRNATYFLRQTTGDGDEDIRESFDEIERALTSSNHIVGELLDYARNPQPNHTEFAAAEATNNALAVLNIGPKVRVEKPVAPELYCIGDQGQIERILVNLISNAVQAMPNGGTLKLACHGRENSVAFEVSDTGNGIPNEHLDKIFDPLFTRKAKGIGLGLAISKRYAELNQGEIDVESEPGQGSTFRLTLPRASKQEGSAS